MLWHIPEFDGWYECISESTENDFFSDKDTSADTGEWYGDYAWCVECDDDYIYISLKVRRETDTEEQPENVSEPDAEEFTPKGEKIMTYHEMTKKYEERGLTDYQLHTLDDLKEIHGLDVRELSGYSGLSENNKNLFNVTVLLFYNAHGLNGRLELKPVSVNYVQEERYISEDDDDVAIEIYLVDGDIVTKQLYSHIFEKGVSFDKCRKVVKRYLRFELCDSFYQFTDDGIFY